MTITEFEKRAKYQNGYDREFDNWKIIDIHQIPVELKEHNEVDFYCSNGTTVYLLRFRNRKNEFYEKVDSGNSKTITYLIAELPLRKEIDDKLIKTTLDKFNL